MVVLMGLTPLMDTEMVETTLGERRYSMRVNMAGRPADEVYDAVGKWMVEALEHIVAIGWRVVGKPEVEETYDFLKDQSILIATVTLVDSMLDVGSFK